nr:MAG TPA: hypothetical protein [Caudoviricetes sp.]
MTVWYIGIFLNYVNNQILNNILIRRFHLRPSYFFLL